jgi:uncharacterized protein (DUF1800 family)
MDDNNALRAHILRRLTFGPTSGKIAEVEGLSPADLIEQILAAPPLEPADPRLGSDDDFNLLPQWWLEVMARPDAGLHERMTWFWHGHLTSGLDKCTPAQMLRQHRLLRTHALGNFRTLLQEITLDAAMLYWLDGAGSTADAPNENYGREVMELFALGRDAGYTEADVRAAAKVLAGWWVDDEHDDAVQFDPDNAFSGAVEFLGKKVGDVKSLIDAVCNHPACARHIAGAIHTFLTGEAPSQTRLDELAASFAGNDLEIRPLVEDIVRHASFLELRQNRPRSAVEWFVAMMHLYDMPLDWWPLEGLGQVPFSPPNVAGWPGNSRWISVGAAYGKAAAAYANSDYTPPLDDADPVGDVLRRAGLTEISDETRRVLVDATKPEQSQADRSWLLHALVACSPEFSIA